ncbi:hypothetical protein ACIQBJ_09600 [Kitasatospora sp. NPDC088391]|uniref:hypothetical protein n=1 Tax=Kitasatospora sp. NPDC088391 TaxID=3364074 RepID=UPI0037F56455
MPTSPEEARRLLLEAAGLTVLGAPDPAGLPSPTQVRQAVAGFPLEPDGHASCGVTTEEHDIWLVRSTTS